MAKVRTAARALGLAGLFAIVLTGTSGCIWSGNGGITGTDSSQTTPNGLNSSDDKMNYSITGVEVHDAYFGDGKVAVIRWHAVNNGAEDIYADPYYFKVYQNKRVLSPDVAADIDSSFEVQELAPGGELDGSAIYKINDMSPITVKISDPYDQSNELNQSFNLE